MNGQQLEIQDRVTAFRKRLIEEPAFRREFATDPEGTLGRSGIPVPQEATLAPLDAEQLEARINRFKAVLGDDIHALYSADDYATLSRDPQRVQRLQEILTAARQQPTNLAAEQLEAVAGGKANDAQVAYTISAFSVIDW